MMLHCLNITEYNNTVHELFGANLPDDFRPAPGFGNSTGPDQWSAQSLRPDLPTTMFTPECVRETIFVPI